MPFLIAAGVILYFLFFEDREAWYPYLIPLAVILAGIYAYHPRIDYWWHKRQAPSLPEPVKKLVHAGSKYYQGLDEAMQQKFLDRLSLFMNHKAFYIMLKEKEAMPEDMKALIGTCAITLGMQEESYFFDKYDYYIAYQHPFPTPEKRYLHSVELNHEDGVMIFNIDQLFQSMILRNGAFNIGLYAFAEAFLLMNPLSELAQAPEPDPGKMPKEGANSLENIIVQIGYREIYFKAVLTALYFDEPVLLEQHYPEYYRLCADRFNSRGKSLS
jgi:hypothetical protein